MLMYSLKTLAALFQSKMTQIQVTSKTQNKQYIICKYLKDTAFYTSIQPRVENFLVKVLAVFAPAITHLAEVESKNRTWCQMCNLKHLKPVSNDMINMQSYNAQFN
ncbi:Hypothetical_protein [Hexamita inflata]|uniref:Hypothetical_protein n=1 Tax=Hexamita inflata TaxID=28002 RepID=A0AA86V3P8_9EUKA|nr:Hypothetical protein HINF_LOCUS62821 [Hexamita inflata]